MEVVVGGVELLEVLEQFGIGVAVLDGLGGIEVRRCSLNTTNIAVG